MPSSFKLIWCRLFDIVNMTNNLWGKNQDQMNYFLVFFNGIFSKDIYDMSLTWIKTLLDLYSKVYMKEKSVQLSKWLTNEIYFAFMSILSNIILRFLILTMSRIACVMKIYIYSHQNKQTGTRVTKIGDVNILST